MTKKQKIWIMVFISIFAIPEILWSTMGNFVYELYKSHFGNTYPLRYNFLQDSNNINLLNTVLFIQLLGLFAALVSSIVLNIKGKKWYGWVAVFILFILTIVAFLIFGLSISLRAIGF